EESRRVLLPQTLEAAFRGPPDEGDPVLLAPPLETLSHRILPLPDEPGERLADDRDLWARGAVHVRKAPPPDERDAERLEVAGGDDDHRDPRRLEVGPSFGVR